MKSFKLPLIVAGSLAFVGLMVVQFGNFEARRLRNKVAELEREKTQLVEYADRLSASRRVAQVNVLGHRTDEAGRPITSLLWQEIGPQGVLAEPRNLEVIGTLVYCEAFVLKFAHRYVGEGDPQRATSLALFRRVFGDRQAPESAPQFDRSSRPPLEESESTRLLHARLWSRFWDLVDDPRLAAEFGVRVAQCEAPAVPMKEGQTWELTLDAAGGLNLHKLSDDGARIGLTPKRE